MELRHPGFVTAIVPFKDTFGWRNTVFYGLPNMKYFSRGLSKIEQADLLRLEEDEFQAILLSPEEAAIDPVELEELRRFQGDVNTSDIKNYLRKRFIDKTKVIKTFRNYHYLNSYQHIITNSIRVDSRVNNTVNIQYRDVSGINTHKVYTLKSDNSIPEHLMREDYKTYESCTGEQMARMYAVGELTRNLQRAYTGEIVVIGQPNIKPKDVCFLQDDYTCMFGPVGVRTVTHVFSPETGFVTEIVLYMLTFANERSSMTTIEAMGNIAEFDAKRVSIDAGGRPAVTGGVLSKGLQFGIESIQSNPLLIGGAAVTLGIVAGAGILGSVALAPLLPIGIFCWKKYIRFTQDMQPMTSIPLTLNGRPLIAGIASKEIDSSYTTLFGKWLKDGVAGLDEIPEAVQVGLQRFFRSGSGEIFRGNNDTRVRGGP